MTPDPPERGFALTALAICRTKYFYNPIVTPHFFLAKDAHECVCVCVCVCELAQMYVY